MTDKATLADVIDSFWDDHCDLDPQGLVEARALVADCKRACTDVLGRIDAKLAEQLGKGNHNVGSHEVRVSKASPVRTGWKTDELLRYIKDHRRFDAEGTLMTDEEKILELWNLPAPRTTVMKEQYGLDPNDERFCNVKPVAKVQVI